MSRTEAQRLTDQFQPRPLRYRMAQHLGVSNSQFDMPQFSPESRGLARVLGAAVDGDAELQARIAAALGGIDQHARVEQAQDVSAVVLEALMVLCHEVRSSAFVSEIAELVNGILVGRHERFEMTPKPVGGILRRRLGLVAERRGSGYVVVLMAKTGSITETE